MRALTVVSCLTACVVSVVSVVWYATADEKNSNSAIPVESLLPSGSVILLTFDGHETHFPALKQTAAWKSLQESELTARMLDLGQMMLSAAGEHHGVLARRLLEHLRTHGVSIASAVSGSGTEISPYAVAVFPQAASFRGDLDPLVELLVRGSGRTVQSKSIDGRSISVVALDAPGTEICWWKESEHLVIAAGVRPSEQVLATVTGKTPDITANPLWTKLRSSDKYTVDSFAWVDLGSLMDQFGDIVLPPTPAGAALQVREFAALLGLHNIREFTGQSGYRGTATFSDTQLTTDGPLTGPMALLQQRILSLDELPPMPKNTSGFTAMTFDLSEAVETVIDTSLELLSHIDPDAADRLKTGLNMAHAIAGIDPRNFAAGLGDVWCVYADPTALPIPVGVSPVTAVSVRDRASVSSLLQRLVAMTEQFSGDSRFSIQQSTRDGRDFYSLRFEGFPFVPTIMLTDKWLASSITPGSMQSFAQRESGRLPVWSPSSDVQQAMKELHGEFTSVTVTDPAPHYTQALQMAPLMLSLIEQQVLPSIPGNRMKMPFGVEDLPPIELVTEPMFPNVTVGFNTEFGIGSSSRESVPSNPAGNVSATVTIPVLVALLLPAVQAAREAARRTQSSNNLKQIGLAMHVYHDIHGMLPSGTVPTTDLPAEERLSWAWSILPFLEQEALYEKMDSASGWSSDANRNALQTPLPVFRNPSQPGQRPYPSSGDYVAMAGVGPNAAELPNDSPLAGIFGFNRTCRFRDVTDGLSNTIMITDASSPAASIFAGGSATIRGFSQSPYLNGPDGIGSPHPGIVNMLLADGSVRAVSVNTDEKTLEALATKAGQEPIPGF